ncbi:MAG: serine hydrolase domain-containing protein [Actinomycetales bacterium]|jgi:CubicO group peptidase (beta-lactamase class C family)
MQLEAIERILTDAVADGVTPSAVCVAAVHGTRLPPVVVGDAVRFGTDGAELPGARRIPATADTVYDLASVTKIFTAVTALTLVDEGVLDLDRPLGHWLAGYRPGAAPATEATGPGSPAGRESVTLRHLLTHTSGLPPIWSGWRESLESGRPFDRQALLADLLATPLAAPPGTAFDYSCVGFNTVMALSEAATGRRWPELVAERVLDKLPPGLTFSPDPDRCAATEYQPDHGRGMVRGTVHDETAWSLGGGCGNAGLFGTAGALLDFGEALRAGLPGILSPGSAREMWRDQLPDTLGGAAAAVGPGYGLGLGLRIGHTAWMGASGTTARGHNGFTGTSLLVDREAGVTLVLLTNRVHPRRERSDVQALRSAVADALYAALP